jgi:peroxiredoxin
MVHEKLHGEEEMTLPEKPPALAIGDKAPSFQGLLGVDGKVYSLASFDDKKVLIIIFMANRCTTNLAYTERIEAIQSDYGGLGVQIVAINSDNPDLLPTESYPEMVRIAKERGYSFPYLKDDDQTVAQDYGAILTLHAFLLDQDRRIRYRGRIDDSPRPAFMTTSDLRNALDDVLAGRSVRVPETSPFGCAIDVFVSCPSCGSRLDL